MNYRTRYFDNRPNYYLNGSSGNVHSKVSFSKYNSLGVKTSTSTSAPYTSISNTASNVKRITDTVYSTSEKLALKRSKSWVRGSKEVNHWRSTFTTSGPSGLKLEMGIKNPTWIETHITLTGLPAEIRSHWGFATPIPGITVFNSNFRISKNAYENTFQNMFKDSSLLNLHDQNLFTTIGELKDFKQTVQTVTKHVFKDKRYIADKYLGVNFGIIPFYQDMRKYVENYNNFAPNLKKWNDLGRKGKILNKHGTITNKTETKTASVFTSPISWPTGVHSYKYRCDYTSNVKIVGKCSAYFRARPLESSFDNLALFASINGLSKPLTAAWNLIPFSFLVDWFVNVGDQIEAFEYHKPVARFDIIGACHSVKVQQTLTCSVTHIDNTNGKETYVGSSQRTCDFYYRIPYGEAFLKALIDGTGVNSPLELKTELSGYQWSLAAALAVTNFPRKK